MVKNENIKIIKIHCFEEVDGQTGVTVCIIFWHTDEIK